MKLTGNNGATLTRNISYESDVVDYAGIGQKTSNGEVKKYTEKNYYRIDYLFFSRLSIFPRNCYR
ncbi:hypothetical protein OL548_29015 [Lysinibacillus sp. MHQ-1]|nr:hypothetical protein OL548_29015 [Lysinibacillus sp. MHQ-1]